LALRRKLAIDVDSMLADFPDVGVSPIRPDTAGITQALGVEHRGLAGDLRW